MRKFVMILMAVLFTLSLSAQGDVYLKNKASDNWFMSLAGGTNSYYGAGSDAKEFVDNLGWEGQLAIGRWNSPRWGARLAVNVGSHKHKSLGPVDGYIKDAFIHPHVDLLWNVSSNKGVYNFIPFVGVGYMYGMDKDFKRFNEENPVFKGQNQSLSWNLGVINDFRFSKAFSMFVELSATTVQGTFGRNYTAQPVGDWEWDIMAQALVGIKFGLGGKQNFTKAELMDYKLINDLNGQINKLRSENESLNKRPEFCPECPEVKPEKVVAAVFVPNVVFFRINSSTIDKQQELTIYDTAQHMLANPKSKVQIVAYADKNTGNPDYNMKLSERRAKAVLDALVTQYSINANRITIDWKGDTTQPYTENDWNRVAIIIVD